MFDRDHEWRSLDRFVGTTKEGTTLGLVYGRRRQGKTFLLESLAEARRGFYFPALRQSAAQNLERLADAYGSFTDSPAGVAFASWDDAIRALLALGRDARSPVPVVIDEFPYLLDGAPELPSLLQTVLSPRSQASRVWRARMILCGSALSTMRDLLGGSAPLRGRASLELMVHPFGYRDAATFWNVRDQPDLAMRLHALVGGTAGYRDMSGGSSPQSLSDFDEWVATALLDTASAMFREGRVLLSEESRVTDTSVYLSVLTAVAQGKTRRGEIAAAVGRAEGALAHPLAVLIEAGLLAPVADALKQRRTTFHIAEPILRFHQLVIAPRESRLARHQGPAVWAELADTVASKIYGPHFEELARVWCAEHTSGDTLGGAHPSLVAPTVLPCREHRISHEVDVVALSAGTHTSQVLAIGEAKWQSKRCDQADLHRLEHLRALIGQTEPVKLLLFSRSGFTRDLTHHASSRPDVELVDPDRLYDGS